MISIISTTLLIIVFILFGHIIQAIKKAIDIENDDDKINVIFISGRGNRSVMCLENGEISSFNDIDEVKNIIGDK